jgi:hypothetical protein
MPTLSDDDLTPDTRRARAVGVPVALGVMGLLVLTGPGAFLLRVMFGMWLHEFGHAIASWMCGVVAVPLPWLTMGGQGRSLVLIVAVFAGLGVLGWRLWQADARPLVALPVAVAGLFLVGVLVPFRHATTFIVFSGDGGALVLGTVLMLGTMLLPDSSRFARGGLRWGYLVIGAGAFVDAFSTWFRAWRDVAELPFGRSETAGLSDATRLVDVSGWSEQSLVRSYLGLAVACFALLAIVATWRLVVSRRED